MSKDSQRYSTENQAAVIATYAQMHGLTIVRTYRDEGESGLRLKNRLGLTKLLNDVQSGEADFDHILVFDVSRWGRFQDPDESAHYEYVCKRAGIKVVYCAEQFNNDGSMISSIMKNLKRVMAAEYSRELSAKVHAGAMRFARLGFQLGGQVGFGLRRQLVDERQQSKAVLQKGQRKYLLTDHIRLQPGTDEEVEVVRRIFKRFLKLKSESAVARELELMAVPSNTGRPWGRAAVGRILRNEAYIGNLVYNRRSRKLGGTDVYNPPSLWVRSEGCLPPIIERETFLAAAKIIAERRVSVPEGEMLTRLRKLLLRRGKLSPSIIDRAAGMPCVASYQQHFGSVREAYRLIGYTSGRDCEYIESRRGWATVNSGLAVRLVEALARAGAPAALDHDDVSLNGNVHVSFRVARWCPGRRPHHAPLWAISRHARLAAGWVIAVRLGERNRQQLDFLLFPTASFKRSALRFSEKARERHNVQRFKDFESLTLSLVQRISRSKRGFSTKPVRQKPALPNRRARKRTGAERR